MLMQHNNRGTTVPLKNLSAVGSKIDDLRRRLAEAVESNTLIGEDSMAAASSEISDAIHQIIINGAALIGSTSEHQQLQVLKKFPDIVEPDAEKLLTDYTYRCEICGRGFKRDANLRVHMRAHGSQPKTPEGLRKDRRGEGARYSCPLSGCNRNMRHDNFRPLKSFVGVKNHFKRCHRPKTYRCDLCNVKSFSFAADLDNHMKHCGAQRCECSCGSTFTRKHKLFRHLTIFDGHFPRCSTSAIHETSKGKEAAKEEDYGFNELIKQAEDAYGFLFSFGNAAMYGLHP